MPTKEKPPAFLVQTKTGDLDPSRRQWVTLRRTKYHAYRFPSWDDAEAYMLYLQRTQPHLALRVAPADDERWGTLEPPLALR